MTTNLFGPQGPNFTTTRPARDANASADTDSWFKNCSAANAKDGTFATADYFNTIIGNLRYLVRTAGVLDSYPVVDNLVYDSIVAVANARIAALAPTLTASRGLIRSTNDFRLALGDGSQTLLNILDPSADRVNVYDASATAVVEAILGKAVNSGLTAGTGITLSYNATTGLTTIAQGAGGGGSVWLFGSGAPSNALGNDSDYYARTDNPGLYVKLAGVWVAIFSNSTTSGGWLFGTGVPAGALGNNGDYYARLDSPGGIYVKLAGVWVALSGGGSLPAGILDHVVKIKSADQAFNATWANVTGLDFAVGANETWAYEATLIGEYMAGQDGSVASNIDIGMNGPASPSSFSFSGLVFSEDATSERVMVQNARAAAYDASLANTVANTNDAGIFGNVFSGRIVNGVNAGTLALRCRAMTGTAAQKTLYAGSILKAWRTA